MSGLLLGSHSCFPWFNFQLLCDTWHYGNVNGRIVGYVAIHIHVWLNHLHLSYPLPMPVTWFHSVLTGQSEVLYRKTRCFSPISNDKCKHFSEQTFSHQSPTPRFSTTKINTDVNAGHTRKKIIMILQIQIFIEYLLQRLLTDLMYVNDPLFIICYNSYLVMLHIAYNWYFMKILSNNDIYF